MPFGEFRVSKNRYTLQEVQAAIRHFNEHRSHPAYAAMSGFLLELGGWRMAEAAAIRLVEPEHKTDDTFTAREVMEEPALLAALMTGYKRASITVEDTEKALRHYLTHRGSRNYAAFNMLFVEMRGMGQIGREVRAGDLMNHSELLYPLIDGYERALARDAAKRRR